jgi:hypothetical protein
LSQDLTFSNSSALALFDEDVICLTKDLLVLVGIGATAKMVKEKLSPNCRLCGLVKGCGDFEWLGFW